MRVGFTGTREGMTDEQLISFIRIADDLHPTIFRHGVCAGADSQAVHAVYEMSPRPVVFGHFGDIGSLTCEHAAALCDDTAQPEPCLNRNRDIVDACDILIACPRGPEERRSGTWATIRYARKQGKPIVIVWPDGSVTKENPSSPA